jgi:hypothetical protein
MSNSPCVNHPERQSVGRFEVRLPAKQLGSEEVARRVEAIRAGRHVKATEMVELCDKCARAEERDRKIRAARRRDEIQEWRVGRSGWAEEKVPA